MCKNILTFVKLNNTKKIFAIFALIFIQVFFAGKCLYSQLSRSVYFQTNIPQANILNPSFTPPYNFYISIPIFSSVYMGFENAFTFNELTSKRADDSLYIDRNKLISKLKPNNYFSFEMFNELIGGGFKIKKNYFHLSISKIYTNKFIFTDNFISFLLYGNGNEQFLGKNIQFNDTKLNMTLYHEFALGMSHEFNEKFHLGLKVKYLNGFLMYGPKNLILTSIRIQQLIMH